MLAKLELRFLAFSLMMGAALASLVAGMGTADPNLSDALDSVTTYFGDNIGVVIAAVVGIVVFVWLLKIALHSFGIRKPTRGIT